MIYFLILNIALYITLYSWFYVHFLFKEGSNNYKSFRPQKPRSITSSGPNSWVDKTYMQWESVCPLPLNANGNYLGLDFCFSFFFLTKTVAIIFLHSGFSYCRRLAKWGPEDNRTTRGRLSSWHLKKVCFSGKLYLTTAHCLS